MHKAADIGFVVHDEDTAHAFGDSRRGGLFEGC